MKEIEFKQVENVIIDSLKVLDNEYGIFLDTETNNTMISKSNFDNELPSHYELIGRSCSEFINAFQYYIVFMHETDNFTIETLKNEFSKFMKVVLSINSVIDINNKYND